MSSSDMSNDSFERLEALEALASVKRVLKTDEVQEASVGPTDQVRRYTCLPRSETFLLHSAPHIGTGKAGLKETMLLSDKLANALDTLKDVEESKMSDPSYQTARKAAQFSLGMECKDNLMTSMLNKEGKLAKMDDSDPKCEESRISTKMESSRLLETSRKVTESAEPFKTIIDEYNFLVLEPTYVGSDCASAITMWEKSEGVRMDGEISQVLDRLKAGSKLVEYRDKDVASAQSATLKTI